MKNFYKGFEKKAGPLHSLGKGFALGSAKLKRIGQGAKEIGSATESTAKNLGKAVKETASDVGAKTNLGIAKAQKAIADAPGKAKQEFMSGARSGKRFSLVGEAHGNNASNAALKEQFKRHTAKRRSDVVKNINPKLHSQLALPAPSKAREFKGNVMEHLDKNKGSYAVGAGLGLGAAAAISRRKNSKDE